MEEYTGWKTVKLSEDNVDALYAVPDPEAFGLINGEYLIAEDDTGEPVDFFRRVGDTMHRVGYRTVTSAYLGEIKPRNPQQRLAIHMLFSPYNTVKVLAGALGGGKDLLMCSAAIELLEREKFEKIVYIRNNIEVKDSKPIGFLPGSSDDKLLPFAMPLADHVGGTEGLAHMISHGQIEIVHLGFIRGRDIRNSIILCSEAENMTVQHIQLLLSRVGEGSELWINGDMRQCDADVFERNSGLMTVVDRLKGHPRFGFVKLIKTERSETASMADLLD